MAGLRRIDRVTNVVHGGSTVQLVETIWSWQTGRDRWSGAFRYQTPRSVSSAGMPVAMIHDHLMLARLAVVALMIGLAIRSLILRTNRED